MIARPRRCYALVLIALGVAVVASGCGTSTTDNAATVEYHDSTGDHTVNIKSSDFQSELGDLVGNPQFQKLLEQQKLKGDGENSTDPKIAAIYLGQVINQVPLDAAFNELHLTVSQKNRDDALEQIKSEFAFQTEADQQTGKVNGPGIVYSAFPKSFQKLLVERAARQEAVAQYYSNPTRQAAIDYFNENKDKLCPSGRTVSHILVKSQAEAQGILNQLKAGAPFGQVAQQKSIDTGSAKVGGALGCLTKGAFVKEFEDAAFNAPFDVPTGPVKSQFGYHVILVQKPSVDSLASQIQSALQQGQAIDQLEKSMKVTIDDPRLGTAKLTQSQQGGPERYTVTPPSIPVPRNDRNAPKRSGATTTTNPLTGG